jgi:hypothetical protein
MTSTSKSQMSAFRKVILWLMGLKEYHHNHVDGEPRGGLMPSNESGLDNVDQKNIDAWFGYASSTTEQNSARKKVREKAKELATLLCQVCPKGGDRGAALRKLREVVMTARDAISVRYAERG